MVAMRQEVVHLHQRLDWLAAVLQMHQQAQGEQVDQSCQSPEESLHDEGTRLCGEMKDYLKRKREETLAVQALKRGKIEAMNKKEAAANDLASQSSKRGLGLQKQ